MSKAARRCLALTALVALGGGCYSVQPPDDVGFGRIDSIQELAGLYRNLGESEPGTPPTYLSAILWPDDRELDHVAVESIRAEAVNAATLRVHALGGGVVRKLGTYTRGQDFELRGGRLSLSRGLHIAGAQGESAVGVYSETIEIGLDQRGDGKYSNRSAGAVLAFLVIPLAFKGSKEVRFVRIETHSQRP